MLYTININGFGVHKYDWTSDRSKAVDWFRAIVENAKTSGAQVIESSHNLTAVIIYKNNITKLIEVVSE